MKHVDDYNEKSLSATHPETPSASGIHGYTLRQNNIISLRLIAWLLCSIPVWPFSLFSHHYQHLLMLFPLVLAPGELFLRLAEITVRPNHKGR